MVREVFGLSFGKFQPANLHEKAEPENMEAKEDAQEDVIDLVKGVHLWVKLVREDSVNDAWKQIEACPDPGENHADKEKKGVTVIIFVHRSERLCTSDTYVGDVMQERDVAANCHRIAKDHAEIQRHCGNVVKQHFVEVALTLLEENHGDSVTEVVAHRAERVD